MTIEFFDVETEIPAARVVASFSEKVDSEIVMFLELFDKWTAPPVDAIFFEKVFFIKEALSTLLNSTAPPFSFAEFAVKTFSEKVTLPCSTLTAPPQFCVVLPSNVHPVTVKLAGLYAKMAPQA